MIDGQPEPGRFAEGIGDIIARAAENRQRVRIFGEMVALLWACPLRMMYAALLPMSEKKKIYDAADDESDGEERYPKVFLQKSLSFQIPCADGASSGC